MNNDYGSPFSEWFEGSKVVDLSGRPLRLYHGTDVEFSEFGRGDVGFHFGSVASANKRLDDIRFGRGEVKDKIKQSGAEYIIPVFLSVKNPLRMPDVGDWADPNAVAMFVGDMMVEDDDFAAAYEAAEAGASGSDFRVIFERMGYDGVVYQNIGEGGGDSWIVFRPDQIRSALASSITADAVNRLRSTVPTNRRRLRM